MSVTLSRLEAKARGYNIPRASGFLFAVVWDDVPGNFSLNDIIRYWLKDKGLVPYLDHYMRLALDSHGETIFFCRSQCDSGIWAVFATDNSGTFVSVPGLTEA